ncbi:uncharacterized protein BX663DRAFT_497678 [Cokeromyces recurvatus]|uniref:uncharacterized protein n=1 Tax=Cokeromyces recurvatus TaxID=90255 RepID=UPI0022200E62|nr:uncharacterized protein BX663DRAFT_497678 [Cokeromyces recurvatus]KAI7906818.1 hypothetical protein BX663DRAFT_497678 [Cokeromyces recurvatus]
MAVCRYFLQGNCLKGNSCNYQHINPQSNRLGSSTGMIATAKYNETSLKTNLTDDRPQWKLSVFGPAKEEPNLIVGTDRSPEEDRLLYYTSMRTTGNANQFITNHDQIAAQVETQVNAIINNPSGAIQHYEKEKSKQASPFGGSAANAPFVPFTNTGGAFGAASNTFGQASAFGAAKPSAFGNTSAFGSTTNAFGSGSVFGQTSAFGVNKPSAFGSAPAFGSTSALGSSSTPAFGSTSALGNNTTSAFGSTSALGSGTPAFGSTSALGQGGGFGTKPTAFGQTPTAFGAAASATPPAFGSTTAFGQTSSLANNNTGFGQAATITNTMNSTTTTSTTSTAKQSDIEAFSAPQFKYRYIPEVEPPIELR